MRLLVRKLEEVIRKSNGVFEFSQDQGCLLRLQDAGAPHKIQLPNLVVDADEQVLLLHLWNERLPSRSAGSTDLLWAGRIIHSIYRSLNLLATYLRDEPQFHEKCAVGGMTILLNAGLHEAGSRIVQKMGFQVSPYSKRLGRFGEFWEKFYSWLIIWTFNPGGLQNRPLVHMRRSEMWMGRRAFLGRYG